MAKQMTIRKPSTKKEEESSSSSETSEASSYEYYDSGDEIENDEEESEGGESDGDESEEEEDEFEDLGSSSSSSPSGNNSDTESESSLNLNYDESARTKWGSNVLGTKRSKEMQQSTALYMHTDDVSSDEEDNTESNRIGRVPLHWYDDLDHIGYNISGERIAKPEENGEDLIDQALKSDDLKNSRGKFTVTDTLNAKEVTLTPRQLEIIRRVQAGAYAHKEFDGNPDHIDYFSGVDPEISALNGDVHPPKSKFQAVSKWEALQVRRLLFKLQTKKITMAHLTGDFEHKSNKVTDEPYQIWNDDDEDELNFRKGPPHIPAPKLPPPTHAESYNPPDEYLPTEEEIKQWNELDIEDRPHGLLIPKKFSSLRHVGAYEHSVREQFQRCLDLYLCPRVLKRRLNIDPETLVPSLPKPSDLRPFPTTLALVYEGCQGDVRGLAISPDAQYLVSACTDGFVRIFEVMTTRLLYSWNLSKIISNQNNEENDHVYPILSVQWNPNAAHHVILAAIDNYIVIILPDTATYDQQVTTQALLHNAMSNQNNLNPKMKELVQWKTLETKNGPVALVELKNASIITQVTWHKKGDYFLSLSPKAQKGGYLYIHQLSKSNSQQPFSKTRRNDTITSTAFHPSKPFLFIATERYIKIYHLVKQTMMKKLLANCRHITSLAIHSSGDHLIVSSLDRKVVYFDLDLSSTPYKTLKYHTQAVRDVKFSSKYPLFASCSDDGSIHVFHCMVFNDFMRNPLIVPVKVIKCSYKVLSCVWHEKLPWIFSGGSDGKIFLFQDI